eukprot:1774902-Rhodomonas_salina.1
MSDVHHHSEKHSADAKVGGGGDGDATLPHTAMPPLSSLDDDLAPGATTCCSHPAQAAYMV